MSARDLNSVGECEGPIGTGPGRQRPKDNLNHQLHPEADRPQADRPYDLANHIVQYPLVVLLIVTMATTARVVQRKDEVGRAVAPGKAQYNEEQPDHPQQHVPGQ